MKIQALELAKCAKLAYQISEILNLSLDIKQAFANTPRTIFAPSFADPFSLDAHPIDSGQWISSPLTVAKMTIALNAKNCDNVLEIGCGSGYQAAILSHLAHRIFSIERIETLANTAKARFKELGVNNVFVRFDDGNNGWSSYAPYDRILLSCGCVSVPERLFSQLKDGGILVAPVGQNQQQNIIKYTKFGDEITSQKLDVCEFVPLLSGRA